MLAIFVSTRRKVTKTATLLTVTEHEGQEKGQRICITVGQNLGPTGLYSRRQELCSGSGWILIPKEPCDLMEEKLNHLQQNYGDSVFSVRVPALVSVTRL